MLRPALLVSAGAAALAWLLGGGNGHPGYDGAFALDAAAQLEAGRASSYAASALAPVAHPGTLVVALGAAPLGAGLLTGATALALGLLVWAAWRLGGLLAAAVVITSPVLLALGVRGFPDVPAAALVLAAVAAAAARAGPLPVLGLLAAAGLFRPEAWLLAAAAWLWLGRPRGIPLALVLAAPAVWLGTDLLLTGHPLRSFTSIREHTARTGNGPTVPGLLRALGALEPWPVWAGAVAGLVIGWRRARRTTALLGAAVGLWLLATLVPALAGATPVPARFLILPAAAAAVGWAVACRARLVPGLALVALTLAVSGPARLEGVRTGRVAQAERAAELGRLRAFVDTTGPRRLLARPACRPLATPGFGFRPHLRRWLGVPARDVAFAYAGGAPARGSVLLPTAPRSAILATRGAEVRARTLADARFRRAFSRAGAGGGWELWTRGACRRPRQ